MAGLGILVAAVQMSRWTHLDPHERATYNSLDPAVGGWHLAQLAIGVLGVLVISGEYSTGMIRSSLMAVPRRLPVLWAKIAVFAAVTFALMLVATFISFFGVQAIVTQHHQQHALSDPGALRVVFGSALFLTALGIMSIALGALVRNTAGGIALFVGLLFVLPGITAILPASVADSITPTCRSTPGPRWPRSPSTTPITSPRGVGSRCSAATRRWRSPRPPSPCSDATPDRDAGRAAGVP